MTEELPKAVQEYYRRILLGAEEEEKEEEKRLGRPLTMKDRVRMMMQKHINRGALAEAFKE